MFKFMFVCYITKVFVVSGHAHTRLYCDLPVAASVCELAAHNWAVL